MIFDQMQHFFRITPQSVEKLDFDSRYTISTLFLTILLKMTQNRIFGGFVFEKQALDQAQGQKFCYQNAIGRVNFG